MEMSFSCSANNKEQIGQNMKRLMFVVVLAVACSSAPVADEPAAAADPAKVAAGLKTADLADGTEDKIVHKCAGCSLAMAGKEAHAISTRGYTLHMCSAACKANYEGDLDNNLSKLAK
jgi:hypothetical protein